MFPNVTYIQSCQKSNISDRFGMKGYSGNHMMKNIIETTNNDGLVLALSFFLLSGDPSCGHMFWKLLISLPDPDLIQTQHQGQGLQQLTKWLKAKFHQGTSTSQQLSSVQVCYFYWKML